MLACSRSDAGLEMAAGELMAVGAAVLGIAKAMTMTGGMTCMLAAPVPVLDDPGTDPDDDNIPAHTEAADGFPPRHDHSRHGRYTCELT